MSDSCSDDWRWATVRWLHRFWRAVAVEMVGRARKSNDAQIMTMGARIIGPELARSLVRIWLASEFTGGPSAAKVQKITAGEPGTGIEGAA